MFESQTTAIPHNLVEDVVESMLARKLPPFLQGNLGAHFQQVETLTNKVDSLGSLLSGVAQKVEAHGIDPLQQNTPKEIVQRVEAIERRVGGLEVEMSKVPPVLASHQNYFLGLRKGNHWGSRWNTTPYWSSVGKWRWRVCEFGHGGRDKSSKRSAWRNGSWVDKLTPSKGKLTHCINTKRLNSTKFVKELTARSNKWDVPCKMCNPKSGGWKKNNP